MTESTNPIHVKGNKVHHIEKAAKADYKKEQDERVNTDWQLRQLGIRNHPVEVNFERTFKKLTVEKKMLKKLKKEHNRIMRLNGFNPKRRINVSGPQLLKFTS